MPDSLNALRHGVAVKTIRRWRREYQRRGRPRGQTHLAAPCPRCDGSPLDLQGYSELFGWYLGDGHISSGRRGVFNLHVFNDQRYDDLNKHVAELMGLVKPGGKPHTRNVPGCVITTVSWKHWPCLFPQHGPGRKHERRLGMQPWQWRTVETYPADFLRGLFHSDGCLARNRVYKDLIDGRKEYVYPRWQFSNASEEILGWCADALDLVGIAWRRSGKRVISVSRRPDVALLTELIGLKS